MATVYVSIGPAGQKGSIDIHSGPGRSETITSSGVTAQGALVARSQEAATIFCPTAVYATVGANPTASTSVGYYVPGGIPYDIMMQSGDILAVIDV